MADVAFAVNINNDNETKMKDKNDDIEDNNEADDGDGDDETPIKGAGDNNNNNNNNSSNSNNNFNMYTIFVCIVACSGALLFGLDVGITGGVMAQSGFLLKFFPSIYEDSQNHSSGNNAYCTFDSQLLAFFTSSFFLAGMVSSIIASKVTATKGRKFSMMVGALLYLLGSLMNALAINTYMLIIGRLFLGFGCGFVNQSVPMFLAEIPPVNIRGALQVLFQASIAIGILIAGLVNYGTAQLGEWGWRVSLGVFIPPSLFMLCAGIFIPETPSGLVILGKPEEAYEVLKKLRNGGSSGTTGGSHVNNNNNNNNNEVQQVAIQNEFNEILEAADRVRKLDMSMQWKTFLSRPYRGELVVSICVALFSQLTGINAIMYFTPQLIASLGGGPNMSLISAIIVDFMMVLAGFTSILLVDKLGRKPLLIGGGTLMFMTQISVAIVLATNFDPSVTVQIDKNVIYIVLVLICAFVLSFGTTWGPLGWAVPVEIQSLETRSAGATSSVVFNFFATFVTTQTFLPMLCTMEYGVFIFFGVIDIIMTLFSYYLIPETKDVPVHRLRDLWKEHWFWQHSATSETDILVAVEHDDDDSCSNNNNNGNDNNSNLNNNNDSKNNGQASAEMNGRMHT